MLAVVHGLATELAVPHPGPSDIARARPRERRLRARRCAPATRARAYAADERFHGVFVARRRQRPTIEHVLDRLAPQLRRLERLAARQLPGRRSVAQHQAIVARAAAGDAVGAASAVRANWMTLGAIVDESFAS